MSAGEKNTDCDCPGIENYFPREVFVNNEFKEALEQCEKLITCLVPMEGSHLDNIENEGYFSIDIAQIEYIDEDFAVKLVNDPLNYFKYLGLATYLVYRRHKDSEAEERSSQAQPLNFDNFRRLWFECTGFSKITPIGEISPPHYNKFVTITGTIAAVGKISQTIYEATFRCDNCGCLQYIIQPMGQLQTPVTCHSTKCSAQSSNNEKPSRGHPITFTRLKNSNIKVASQMISVIQTRYNSKTSEKQVHVLKVQLINHLIEKCFIMDSVTISGVVVEPKNIEGTGICGFYMLASSLLINTEDKFDSKTLRAIQAITSEPDILGLVTASFCPAVSCNNMVKLGVLLSLIGGHESDSHDEEDPVPYRGQIHTLLLGAPNKDKKELLNAAHKVAPISSYADKSYTQNLVFDVKIEKGEEVLHTGPVLQANKGVCCIDDLDVMKSQWNLINEIMESQIFQVDKNSFVRSVPVEIAIFASATPTGGTYRFEKTLYENIKMPSDILNQFDLIFHLVDEPDHQTDRSFTKRVLQNREGRLPSSKSQQSYRGSSSQSPTDQANQSLKRKLAVLDKDAMDLLPRKLLTKYIQFVRAKIFPKFDEEAHATVFRFYEEYLEKTYRGVVGPIEHPSDNQLLASLMRLSLARARLEAKQVVTKRDVLDIVELIKYTRSDIFPKDVLTLNSQSSQSSLRRSIEPSSEGLVGLANKRCRSSNERFVRYLEDYFHSHPETEFSYDDLWTIARNGPPVAKFEQMIEFLNHHGYILQCGNSRYRWVTRR